MFVLTLCLWFCLPVGPAHGGQQAEQRVTEGVVAYCFDGDTLKLTDRRVVRLAGIDAPEMARPARGGTKNDVKKGQYYARQARQSMVHLAQGKKVRLFPVTDQGEKDDYGRIIADVRLEDGQSLSALMVGQGAAFFYPHTNLNGAFMQRLLQLQKRAIAAKSGLWAHLLGLPLALNSYVGNRSSLRFFPGDCPEAQHIKPRNRIYFGTLMDAFLAGYAPARICLFWPTEQ
ncbi:MAG: thermonuclease family protein [Desulfovibrio sp.]|nr:thermonuclease family protein [Desulfovibrio sp.]